MAAAILLIKPGYLSDALGLVLLAIVAAAQRAPGGAKAAALGRAAE